MSDTLVHHTLPSSRPSLGLVLSIAMGLWLGLGLTFASGWLIWRYGYGAPTLFAVTVPVTVNGASAGVASVRPETTPAPPARHAEPAQPQPTDAAPMFDQYQQNLRQQAERDAEAAARANPANQSNAACQFWLQQAQTAPSDHSREQVAKLCR
jgi:hypothetical protein